MGRMTIPGTRKLLVLAAIACLQAQPAAAGPTDISPVPLASSSGTTVLPNLMFMLDASGSMDWDFLPDYVNGNISGLISYPCLVDSSGNQQCSWGDPPYLTGGQHGFNGVGYDPNTTYPPGLKSDGTTVLATPLSLTALPVDAYGAQSTSTINLTTGAISPSYCDIYGLCNNGLTDKQFCNSQGVCKRNGADTSGNVLPAGRTDGFGHTLATGQFPYRTNPSNASVVTFGLPEMMSQGIFSRSGTTVTVQTIEAHGLTTSSYVYVASPSSLAVTCVPVTSVPTPNSFTYTTSTSGTVGATNGSYRACAAATFTRASTLVTVTTPSNHGLVTNDVITVNVPGNSAFNATNVAITVTSATTFTYTTSTSGTISSTSGWWVRTGLYNRASTVNGPPVAYQITPVEYCSDINLVNCVEVVPPAAPPPGFFPAYVRYCQTQMQAVAPGAVSGKDSNGNPLCIGKYVNSGVLPVTYLYPRFGWFNRDTIQPSVATYGNRPNRTDCASPPNCTYNEEIQNYANWYTYYHTRTQMMKTVAGRALLPLISNPSATPPKPDVIRVGFITINPFFPNSYTGSQQSTVQSSRYLAINNFNTTQASNWYSKFYAQVPTQSTPLREAVSRVGWIYAGKLNTGLTAGIPLTDDPVQNACQRNYLLMTTDGFWNGNAGQTLSGASIGNLDNVNPTFVPGFPTQPLVDRATTGNYDGGGATTTTITPTSTTKEQVICINNNTTNFSFNSSASPQQTACGCAAGSHKLIERDILTGQTTVTTEGVVTSQGTSTVTTFTDQSACVAATVVTTTTPIREDEQVTCRGNATTTFSTGNGNSQQTSCGCSGTNRRTWQRTTTGTQTVVTTDGQVTSTSVSLNPTGAVFTPVTSCGSSGITLSPNPKDTATGSSSSTTSPGTPLTIALSPNPQTITGGTPTSTTTPGGTANTLADTTLYYYRTPLRGGTDLYGQPTGPKFNLGGTGTVDLSGNNVPVASGATDFLPYQHMVTFTVGMADGLMRYQSDYATATSGDFYNIKQGTLGGCFWTKGFCDWPAPTANDPSALDDLWHAAVNGRGQYYQATNVTQLTLGLQSALTALNAQVAAAAASATSSPNVTQTSNQIFSTIYETVTWSGKVFAQTIDPTTGNVNPTHQWDADQILLTQVAPSSDTRTIWTLDTSATSGSKLKSFAWSVLTPTEQAWFANKCTPLTTMTQCATLTAAQLVIANDGSQMVGFLRGQTGNEGTVFRDRTFTDPTTNAVTQTVLGDTISAKPLYVQAPTFNYADAVTPSYATFAAANANRAARLYVAANDGYLHAFDASASNPPGGSEVWAYLPHFLMPGLYALADTNYAAQHRYYADGSPVAGDIFDGSNWRTILVAGVNGGGRGYYALDITDPNNPKALWEFCSDATLCANSDSDLGFSYGNPVIGKRASDGRWVVVVTSGLNNVSPGSGVGFFYVLDALTGTVLNKVSTGVGSTTTPSGLMKISAFYNNALTDATFQYVYGGDQLGNVWRLDVGNPPNTPGCSTAPCVLHIATLTDGSSPPRVQPITTQPALTHIGTSRVIYIGTGRYLGDGTHGGLSDLSDPGAASGVAWTQTIYGFKDKNADYDAGKPTRSLRANANLVQQSFTFIDANDRGITANPVDWNVNDGWFVDLVPVTNPSTGLPDSPSGERVNVDPRLVLGTLVVATNIPVVGASSCTAGGTSRLYNFDFKTGSSIATAPGGIVGSSLGGSIVVGMAIVQLPSGAIKDIVTQSSTAKSTTNVSVNASGAGVQRFYYRIR